LLKVGFLHLWIHPREEPFKGSPSIEVWGNVEIGHL
jgi:hypothetical protein